MALLVMRGDTVHSQTGASYANGHFGRIHCYLDRPLCKRGYNSTERIDVTRDCCVPKNTIVTVTASDGGKNRKRKRLAKKYLGQLEAIT